MNWRFWTWDWSWIDEALEGDHNKVVLDYTTQIIINSQPTMSPSQTAIYNTAKQWLGKHVTLNSDVPPEVGCAEAVSFILKNAGVGAIPVGGFAGTASLYDYLVQSPYFERIQAPEQGCIVVSPTGSGNGNVRGHTGIFGAYNLQYPNDWGILSNDSSTGLFLELWRWTSWEQYYGDVGGLTVALFRAK